MDTVKRFAAVFLGILLLYGCTADVPAQDGMRSDSIPDPVELTETIPQTTASSELLEQPEDAVYEKMCSELRVYQSSVSLEGSMSGEILDEAFYRIGREHPELFWVTGYSATYNDHSASVEFKVLDDLPGAELRRMSAELDETAEAVARQARLYPSDYDRVLYVHDYIVEHTDYDAAGAATDLNGIWGTAYGCLINGSAVCQGYAEAFQLIMSKLEIPAGVCSGMTEYGSHAWNYVTIDGSYYWLDATWDDPSFTNGEGNLRHTYFLLNDELLYRSRTIDTERGGVIPVCSSLDANYFVRNGDYLTGYRFSDIDMRLTEARAEGCIEVMFASENDLDAAVTALFAENEIWNASIFRDKAVTVQYSVDEMMYVLRIGFVYD